MLDHYWLVVGFKYVLWIVQDQFYYNLESKNIIVRLHNIYFNYKFMKNNVQILALIFTSCWVNESNLVFACMFCPKLEA